MQKRLTKDELLNMVNTLHKELEEKNEELKKLERWQVDRLVVLEENRNLSKLLSETRTAVGNLGIKYNALQCNYNALLVEGQKLNKFQLI